MIPAGAATPVGPAGMTGHIRIIKLIYDLISFFLTAGKVCRAYVLPLTIRLSYIILP